MGGGGKGRCISYYPLKFHWDGAKYWLKSSAKGSVGENVCFAHTTFYGLRTFKIKSNNWKQLFGFQMGGLNLKTQAELAGIRRKKYIGCPLKQLDLNLEGCTSCHFLDGRSAGQLASYCFTVISGFEKKNLLTHYLGKFNSTTKR